MLLNFSDWGSFDTATAPQIWRSPKIQFQYKNQEDLPAKVTREKFIFLPRCWAGQNSSCQGGPVAKHLPTKVPRYFLPRSLAASLGSKTGHKLAYSLHSEREVLVYCLLKLLGASNACLNPFLYGYLNENFRQEYRGVKKQFYKVPRLHTVPTVHM